MLAKVFRPGTHDERLHVAVRHFEVSANSPVRRTFALADAPEFAQRLDVTLHPLRQDVVFNRDQ